MPTQIQDSGIVETTYKEFPVLAVNVLERLGYHISRASKQLDQILANERVEEQVGRDWWRHEYRVVLRWRKTTSGQSVLVTVEMSEHKGGGSLSDCQKRCDKLLLELQRDAERVRETSFDREPNTSYGSARWGREDELIASGYLQKNADPKRLIIGKAASGEYLQIPERLTYSHALHQCSKYPTLFSFRCLITLSVLYFYLTTIQLYLLEFFHFHDSYHELQTYLDSPLLSSMLVLHFLNQVVYLQQLVMLVYLW